MRRRTVAVLTAAGVAGIFLAGGCGYEQAICSSGEYPVKTVRSLTGGTCVPDGEAPPAGHVRYPEGKVPKIVGDNWDRYWHQHMLDENGRELSADQERPWQSPQVMPSSAGGRVLSRSTPFIDQAAERFMQRLTIRAPGGEEATYGTSLLNLMTALRGTGHRPAGADDAQAAAWLPRIETAVGEVGADYQRRAAAAATATAYGEYDHGPGGSVAPLRVHGSGAPRRRPRRIR